MRGVAQARDAGVGLHFNDDPRASAVDVELIDLDPGDPDLGRFRAGFLRRGAGGERGRGEARGETAAMHSPPFYPVSLHP